MGQKTPKQEIAAQWLADLHASRPMNQVEIEAMIESLDSVIVTTTAEVGTHLRLAKIHLTIALECITGARDAFTGKLDAFEGRR